MTDATDDYARAGFHTWGLRHDLVIGVNDSRYSDSEYGTADLNGRSVMVLPIGMSPYALQGFFPFATRLSRTMTTQTGLYGQDLVEIGRVHFLGGIRYTHNSSYSFLPATDQTSRATQAAITPDTGIVVDIDQHLSTYFSVVRGFVPNYYLSATAQPIPPTRSTNYETGFKVQLFRNRLNVTSSIYRLEESSHVIAVPGLYNRFEALPGLRSDGFETDMDGMILPDWLIAASYTYANYRYLQPQLIGLVTGQPRQKGSLFTRYTLQSGALRNLGAAIGVYAFSASNTSTLPGYRLPTQISVDENLYDEIGRLQINVGITNIVNHTLFNVSNAASYVPLQGPRTYRGSLTYSFF